MAQKIRPGDVLRDPVKSGAMGKTALEIIRPDSSSSRFNRESALAKLPASWRTALDRADEWVFVDPDVMLSEPTASFGDYPADALPVEVVPFSEFEPWGKMDEETPRDYELFSYHRALGLSRTQSATAKHFGISQAYVSKLSAKYNWPDRIQEWDEYREKVYTTEVIEQTRKMARDHAHIANKGIRALEIAFDELLARMESEDPVHKAEMAELGVKSLFAMVEKAARAIPNLMNAERLSRGMPTELSAQVIFKENRVVVQTTDDLAEIVSGLQSVFQNAQETQGVEMEDDGFDPNEIVIEDIEEDIEDAEYEDELTGYEDELTGT